MIHEQNITTVKEIYDAVGRGDVDWAAESASKAAPWYGQRTGKDGAGSFFADLASNIEITQFTPRSYAAGDDDVHLLVDWAFRSVTTSRKASMTMHHYWRLHDGIVVYFRGSEDTELTAKVFAA